MNSGSRVVRMVHDHDMYCMRSYKYNLFQSENLHSGSFRLLRLPLRSITCRETMTIGFPIKWISYKAKGEEIQLNQQFQRLVVYSEYTKKELVRNGFAEKKIEIHVPIRKQEIGGNQSSFSDRNLILFAGQIIRGKGVDVLLEILAMVKVPFECIFLERAITGHTARSWP